MAITGMMMNKNFFVLLLTCTCLICSPFYGGVTPIAGSNVSNKPNFPPTLLHAFALPPYSCNAMGLFLLTEVSRNSSALPGVGSAEGGGNMCEGQERGISGVIRHSRAYGNPVLSLSTGMTSQGGPQGMCRSPVATTTVIPAMSTRSPARRTFRMPPREEAWKARKSVLPSTLLQ